MVKPEYTGDTLKQELTECFLAGPSNIKIVDITEIGRTAYLAIVNKSFRTNMLQIYKQTDTEGSYEKVLEERRDANTWLLPEDDYKHALRLFEEVKKRKKEM